MLRQRLRGYKCTLVALLIAGLACLAEGAEIPKALVLAGFELIDEMDEFTSEAQRRDDARRVALAGDELRREFERRGLYRIQPEGPRIARCWVQKVSNLILNLNIEVRDAATNQVAYRTSVDIRGNTDESWLRGVRRLADNIEARDLHLR